MRKQITSVTLSPPTLEFVDHIAEINSVSRSKAMELLIDLVQDYFTEKQIAMEYEMRGVLDGRAKNQG